MPFVYTAGGFILGFISCLIFFWRLGKDAQRVYDNAEERFKDGTEQYRKAAQVLEIVRMEGKTRVSTFVKVLTAIKDIVAPHLPPDAAAQFQGFVDSLQPKG